MAKPRRPASTHFARLLVAHRDARSPGNVCAAAGITGKALRDIEAGDAWPTISVLAALCRRYGLSRDQIVELIDAVPERRAPALTPTEPTP